ncbi:hypothetical protein MKZ38_006554 [Zalerion maritima]|uniref:arginine--tRNA ligase n=1 Tax=Zalerion maritima TaxID=339359 RepID=A0AAD5RZ50_9PEZI|nr:hypothetical protein MKZ38_006554 [Zalerion maritima]
MDLTERGVPHQGPIGTWPQFFAVRHRLAGQHENQTYIEFLRDAFRGVGQDDEEDMGEDSNGGDDGYSSSDESQDPAEASETRISETDIVGLFMGGEEDLQSYHNQAETVKGFFDKASEISDKKRTKRMGLVLDITNGNHCHCHGTLNLQQFHQALSKKACRHRRFNVVGIGVDGTASDDAPHTSDPFSEDDIERRLIYARNPDPQCVSALFETASRTQAGFFRDFVFRHLISEASIGVTISRGFPTFALYMQLPYFVLRNNRNCRTDPRRGANGGPLKKSVELRFLASGPEPRIPCLYEGEISVLVMGIDNLRWTALAFDDAFFNKNFAKSYDGLFGGQEWPDPLARSQFPVDDKHPQDPRIYFLRLFVIWICVIEKEAQFYVRTLTEQVERQKKTNSHPLSRDVSKEKAAAEDPRKLTEWNTEMVTSLGVLRDPLSRTVQTGKKFLEDDSGFFCSPNKASQLYLQDIRKKFSQLDLHEKQLDNLEKELDKQRGRLVSSILLLQPAIENTNTTFSQQKTAEYVKILTVINVIFSPVGLASNVISTQVFPQNLMSFLFSLLTACISVATAFLLLLKFDILWTLVLSFICRGADGGTCLEKSGKKVKPPQEGGPGEVFAGAEGAKGTGTRGTAITNEQIPKDFQYYPRPDALASLAISSIGTATTMRSTDTLSALEASMSAFGLDDAIPAFPGANVLVKPIDIYQSVIAGMLQKFVESEPGLAYESIQRVPINTMENGDLDVVLPRLKLSGVDSKELAADLLKQFPRPHPLFMFPFKDGVHLRLLFSPKTLPRLLLPYISDRKEAYGRDASRGLREGSETERKRVIVEFSSPNVASEFKSSHLTSTIFGAFVSNIYEAMGWDVVRTTYIGDWGRHIGLLGVGWKKYATDEEWKNGSDAFRYIYDVYKRIEEVFKPEQEASRVCKDDKKALLEIQSRGLFAKRDEYCKSMEDGDEESLTLWRSWSEVTRDGYANMYAKLGLKFDYYAGESEVCLKPEHVTEAEAILKERGISEESDGCWIIDFEKHGAPRLGKAHLRDRIGLTNYFLRDIATVFYRFKTCPFDKMIYVVSGDQDTHFRQLFKTVELMGYADLEQKLHHVSFAKANRLSSQLGNAELLGDILSRCEGLVEEAMSSGGEGGASAATAGVMGISGLVVQDLARRRLHEYTFDINQLLLFEGSSGPALHRGYERLCSAITSLGRPPPSEELVALDYAPLHDEPWINLLRLLARYPDATDAAYRSLEPSGVLSYLARIMDELHSCLDEIDEEEEGGGSSSAASANVARVALLDSTRQVVENGMQLLGVGFIKTSARRVVFGDEGLP